MPSLKANGKRLNGTGSGWIVPARRLAIYLRDRFVCQYCGTDLSSADPRDVSLDHLHPQVKGGTHESTNLVTACTRCNSRRQHKTWWTFAPPGSVKRIKTNRNRVPPLALAKAIIAGNVPKVEVLNSLSNRS